MASEPEFFLITGIMAAGKSTVAQALAERFPLAAHVRGDTFRRFVVSGWAEMSGDPTAEALAQLRLRYELATTCADRYVESGITTVMQDVIIGPMLLEVVNMIRTRPLSVIVLAPSPDEVGRREASRPKTGYVDFTPSDLDEELRERTARIGLWIDSDGLSVEDTVQTILDRRSEALISS